jgi:hypothetical protein
MTTFRCAAIATASEFYLSASYLPARLDHLFIGPTRTPPPIPSTSVRTNPPPAMMTLTSTAADLTPLMLSPPVIHGGRIMRLAMGLGDDNSPPCPIL